ncbi:Tricarboxylate/iron carrier [Wallemia mellicola]|uniref:Tricarboxylate/iron carrier n=1 Tax=Wallemia mellicola TaxID=1708541 RepID=A0AB38N2A9_9BASI|nr:Tricarboxylate/iron carrier [Wallemia mellicola]
MLKIRLAQPRYDQSTYLGRVRHFIAAVSPLTLFASSERLAEAQKEVYSVQERIKKSPDGVFVTPEDAHKFWKNKQLVDSSIHPDTGEPIVLPFRMSAFMPTNLIIIGGMLAPNPSLGSVIFWQWMNQSLNVCVNSANANKSTPLSTKELALSYVAATASSVGIAVSLTKGVPKLNVSAATKVSLGRMVPFASVVTAGCVNIAAMRYKEMRDGIQVTTSEIDGKPVKDEEKINLDQPSRVAGTVAVAQTAASRVFTNIPTLIFVPLIQAALTKKGVFKGKRGPMLERIVSLGLAGTSMIIFLPPAIAVFPQKAALDTETVFGRDQDIRDDKGRKVTRVEFNRDFYPYHITIIMDYIKSWFGGGDKDAIQPPAYDPSKDKPKDLPKFDDNVSQTEKEEVGQQQATYSPYSLPPDSGLDSAQHIEMRRRIGQASLENCSVIESMLSECIRNGSFTEKRVRGCDWLREQFYSCLTEQRNALTELGYAIPGNTPERDFKIQSLADRLSQEKEKEAKEGKGPFDSQKKSSS